MHSIRSLLVQNTPKLLVNSISFVGTTLARFTTRRINVLRKDGETKMLWTILVILLILWLLGLIGGVGGSLIHLLLVIAAIVLIIQLVTGRRTVV